MDLSTPLRRKLVGQFWRSITARRARQRRRHPFGPWYPIERPGSGPRLWAALERSISLGGAPEGADAPDTAPLDPADAEALARFLGGPRPRWRKGAR